MPWAATQAVAGPPDPASAGDMYVSMQEMLQRILMPESLMPISAKHHGLAKFHETARCQQLLSI